MPEARLIVFRSPNGETDWQPVLPEDVPEWLKDPAVLGRLVDEQTMAQGPSGVILPDELHPWYRVERAPAVH